MVFRGGLEMAAKNVEAEGRIEIRTWEGSVDAKTVLWLDASEGMPEAGWPTESRYPGVWAYLDSHGNWLLVGYSRANVWKAGFNPFLCKYGVCSLPLEALDEIDPVKAEIMKRAVVFRYWLCQSARDALNMKKRLCLSHQPLLNRPPAETVRNSHWN
jgi:hypothetical protein